MSLPISLRLIGVLLSLFHPVFVNAGARQDKPPVAMRKFATFDSLASLSNKKLKFVNISMTFGNDDWIDIPTGTQEKALVFTFCDFFNPVKMSGTYNSRLEFAHCSFRSSADFSYSHFNDNLKIVATEFTENPNFKYCRLPAIIFLDHVDFKGDNMLDFSSCFLRDAEKKCKLVLTETQVSNMVLPYELFEYDFDTASGHNVKNIHDHRVSVYETLIKNCREAGLMESAKGWDIDYKTYTYERNYWLGGPLNFANKYWWNFGYNKSRIFWFWLPMFFCLFVLVNYFFVHQLRHIYYDDEIVDSFRQGDPDTDLVLRKNKFMYTVTCTAAIYFNFWLKISAIDFSNHRGVCYVFLMYLTGSLHVIFGIGGYILNT